MKQYVLFFRMDLSKKALPSEKQITTYMEQLEKWIHSLIKQNKLAPGGNHLSREGMILEPGKIKKEGPFVSKKQSVAGYILIHSKNKTEALKLASACPILKGEGTSVEVREIQSTN